MAEYLIQSETLDDIADAINAKTGGSSAMTPAEMVTAIGSISGGGGSTPFVVSADEYIHAEDWLSDAIGNTLNFSKTYLDYDNHPVNFKIAYIENNRASNYVASVMWNYPTNASTTVGSGSLINTYSNRPITSSASFWISAGAKITVLTLSPINRDSSLGV